MADSDEQMFRPDESFEEWDPPSLAEVNKFICWAKEHINIDIDSFTWDLRVGATKIVFKHYKEAIAALEKAEQHSQTNWGLSFYLAKAHEKEKKHRKALKYIKDFKALSDLFLKTDYPYKTAYWQSLLAEGNCYRQCHDYDLAVKSFQDLLDQDIDEEPGMRRLHLYARSGLFKIWTEAKRYQSIKDFIHSWKDTTDQSRGPTYWLRNAAYEDDCHASIIIGAKHAGVVEEIISLYQEAIDYKPRSPSTVDEQGMDTSAEATEQLQYFQTVLRCYGSRSWHDQHRSIQYWEAIVQRSDENPALFFTAWKASHMLAPTLLDKAVAELLTAPPSSCENYISRLEKLAKLNTTLVCELHQGFLDPRLCLTRLYCMKKDHTTASMQAQARLCSTFDKWPEDTDDNSLSPRFSNLAQTLTVLDKDVDAVAAWQAIKPYRVLPASGADADVPDNGELTQPSSEVFHTNGVPAASDMKSEGDQNASLSTTTTTKAYISEFWCDGDCGTEWHDILADCWVCKHCLCVQFCSGCHRRLLGDDLHHLICNKNHEMLFLPPFDWKAWRTIPVDMMTVDKKLVRRLEWVDRIRKEYNVQQGQIDFIKIMKARELKAAEVITVRWRSRLQRIRAKKQSTAPTLRRAKTVG